MSNYCKECYKKQEQIEQLQAENERLKEEINRNGREWENHCNAQYWQMQSIIDKYRQALQEIREIAEEYEKKYLLTQSGVDFFNTLEDKINSVIGAEE